MIKGIGFEGWRFRVQDLETSYNVLRFQVYRLELTAPAVIVMLGSSRVRDLGCRI